MSSSDTQRPLLNADLVRRLIHVVLLVVVIVGVRACGGAASAEDRLGAGTQWFAERTGLAAAKARWDKSIRPPIAAITGSASAALYAGLSRSLERASTATDETAAWTKDIAVKTVDGVANGVAAVFAPGGSAPPPPNSQPEAPPPSPAAP